MTLRDEYLRKIDELPTVSYNREQKAIARKIIEGTSDVDLAAVYSLLTRRIKTGFVFDEAPEVNHNAVALVRETPKLNVNVAGVGALDDVLEHKLIIGENYDALKNLCATYVKSSGEGMIDVIYIDPPYNTEATKKDGNDYKDEVSASKFIYRDKFTRDGWLNMMNERLKLARRLLSDKGVIFISIDDSEQAYLKVLCDEIFGEENFVACLPTVMNLKGNQDEYGFAGTHEYTLVYAKDKEVARFGQFVIDENDEARDKWQRDDIGYYKKGANLKSTGVNAPRTKRPNLFFPIYVCSDGKISVDQPLPGSVEIFPITNGEEMSWRWSKDKFRKNMHDVIVSSEDGLISIYKKQRPELADVPTKKPKTLFYKPEYSSGNGTAQLKDILGAKLFANPKPTALIKDFVFLASQSDSLILDFFAGSGTTGQAVMELNEEYGGKRRFILVTNNENGIGEKITRERLHRVITGHGSKGEEIAWRYSDEKPSLTGNGVRVFGIETHELTLEDLELAEKLKDVARVEFGKLNPAGDFSDEFDLYNELAALNPQKREA